MNWSRVVGTATKLRALQSRVRIPVEIFLFSEISRPAQGSTQAPIERVPGFYPDGKTAGAWI